MPDVAQQGTPPRFFTAADASRLTGFSYGFIRELARNGELPVVGIVGRHAPLLDDAGIKWLERRRARTDCCGLDR